METPEYAAMMRRLVRRYGVRVGQGDPVDLTTMAELVDELDTALRVAVAGLHEAGFSWREIGEGLGITKQAALMRFRSSVHGCAPTSGSKSA